MAEIELMIKKNSVVFIAIAFFAFAVVWNLYIDNDREIILEDIAYAQGVVTKTKYQKGGSWLVYYQFNTGSKVINEDHLYGLCSKLSDQIEKRTFTVLYNRQKPEYSTILITEETFEAFDLAFPDSLKWTIESCE